MGKSLELLVTILGPYCVELLVKIWFRAYNVCECNIYDHDSIKEVERNEAMVTQMVTGIYRNKPKTKTPTIKFQFFETLGKPEGLFHMQKIFGSLGIWGDDALNSVLPVPSCRAMLLISTVGSMKAGMPLLSRGPAQGVTQPCPH